MDTAIGVLVRPLTALVLFLSAYFIARAVLRLIPEGRVKSVLTRRYEVVPTGPVSKREQKVARIIIWTLVIWIGGVQILKFLGIIG